VYPPIWANLVVLSDLQRHAGAQTFLPVPRRPLNGRWPNCQPNLSQISLAPLVPPDPVDRPDWILPWDINCMQALRATTYHTLHWALPTHPPAAMDLPPIVLILNHGRRPFQYVSPPSKVQSSESTSRLTTATPATTPNLAATTISITAVCAGYTAPAVPRSRTPSSAPFCLLRLD
jgi:hypothetical protein